MVSSDQPVFRLVILVAIVPVAGCGRETTVADARSPIMYIDATDGPSGNTTLDTGESFTAVNTAAVRSDNLWTVRPHGNNGTVFTSNDIGGTGTEDAPALMTTIRGLEPDGRYEIFAYFWSDRHNWHLKASLTPFRTDESGVSFSKDATESSAVAPPAVEADFNSVVLVTESNRTMYQADVGETIADGNGEIRVWIDDNPNAPEQLRTWYDGVGYRLVGHRVDNGRIFAGVAVLGAVILAALLYLTFRLLRSRRRMEHPAAD